MKIIRCNVDPDYKLVVSSDWHVGANNTHYEAIRSLIAYVKESGSYLTLNGDLMETIDPSNKHFSAQSVDRGAITGQEQVKRLVELLLPIKDRILCIGMGNHEHRLINSFNPTLEMCERLGVPYGTVTYVLEMANSGKVMHKHLLTHGSGMIPKGAKDPIQRKANRAAWIKRQLEGMGFGDTICHFMGHTHHLQVVNPTIEDEAHLVTKNGRIKQLRGQMTPQNIDKIPHDARWYCNTGSFLRLYSDPDTDHISYGEMRLYGPPKLGYCEVVSVGGCVTEVREVVV